MAFKTAEKTVFITKDGTPLSIMERPEGLGTFADYHRKVEKYRRQYAHLLDRQSFEEYLAERREEAAINIKTFR